MQNETEKYYIICENWCLDASQWSIVLGTLALLLTLLGFIIAYLLYIKQRRDSARDAFNFFQDSLIPLKNAIEQTINELNNFKESLDSPIDGFNTPILNSSLNDNFLTKINLVDLNRFYLKNEKSKHKKFKEFLVYSNFFGNYNDFITSQIGNLLKVFNDRELKFSKWQLLRTKYYYIIFSQNNEKRKYNSTFYNFANEYIEAISQLYFDKDVINDNEIVNRDLLDEKYVQKIIEISRAASQYLPLSDNNIFPEINGIANEISSARKDIIAIKSSIKKVIEGDQKIFSEKITPNIDTLIG